MGSYHTTLCLVNFSGKKITATRASDLENSDWDGDARPDHNFGGALVDGDSRCERAELNSNASSSWFWLTVTFDDGSKIRVRVNQHDAYARKFGVYPTREPYQLEISAQNNHLSVVQATGRDTDDDDSGATWTNALYIRPSRQPDNSDWMTNLRSAHAGIKLNQITMPGSHDAGMYVGTNDQFVTQSLSIGNQLRAGSRYFDIRTYNDGGTITTYHGEAVSENGGKLGDILTDVREFVDAHPDESVFLKFRSYEDPGERATLDLVKRILRGRLYVRTDRHTPTFATQTLDSLHAKGKVVAAFHKRYPSSLLEPANGTFRYADYGDEDTGKSIVRPRGYGSLGVYDSYSNRNDFDTMGPDQRAKWSTHCGIGKEYLYLLSWTLSGKPGQMLDLELLSRTANPRLPKALHEMRADPAYKAMPNIVYLDYVDPWLCKAIIAMNGV